MLRTIIVSSCFLRVRTCQGPYYATPVFRKGVEYLHNPPYLKQVHVNLVLVTLQVTLGLRHTFIYEYDMLQILPLGPPAFQSLK